MLQINFYAKKCMLFCVILLFFACSDNKKSMDCKNLEKELGLPMFLVLDKNIVNSQNDEITLLFKKIDENNSDDKLISELKKDLDVSYNNSIKDGVFEILFSNEQDNSFDVIKLSYKHAEDLLDKFKNKELEGFDKNQLKFLLFKKMYLHSNIHDSWFVDAPLIEFNKGVLSEKGKDYILSYYDHGNFIEFKNKTIDLFIKNDFFEENLIEINTKFYPEMILEPKKFKGKCKLLYDWYQSLYRMNKKEEYIIVLYNM